MSTRSASSISPVQGPLRQTQPIHPQDTQLRVNYRPTPLPASHRFNSPYPHDAPMASSSGAGGSARWLSEDEGTGGTRLHHTSPEDSEGNAGIDAGSQSAGLRAAKDQWKSMRGSTERRQRMRRTASIETSLEAASATASPDATPARSGHPLAASQGLPLPAIKSLTTTRMLPGGTSTFEASEAANESQTPASTSAAEDTSSKPESSASRLVDASVSTSGGLSRTSTREGQVPDFADGRGGDGIGGVGQPSEGDAEEVAAEERLLLLEKLRKIMGW